MEFSRGYNMESFLTLIVNIEIKSARQILYLSFLLRCVEKHKKYCFLTIQYVFKFHRLFLIVENSTRDYCKNIESGKYQVSAAPTTFKSSIVGGCVYGIHSYFNSAHSLFKPDIFSFTPLRLQGINLWSKQLLFLVCIEVRLGNWSWTTGTKGWTDSLH